MRVMQDIRALMERFLALKIKQLIGYITLTEKDCPLDSVNGLTLTTEHFQSLMKVDFNVDRKVDGPSQFASAKFFLIQPPADH